ncbi:unnamed protein product, partial [Phaeothamnion confervicola]
MREIRAPLRPCRSILSRYVVFIFVAFFSRAGSREIEAAWEFLESTEGWGDAAAEEVGAELHHEGGSLVGTVTGPEPRLDSPPVWLRAIDRHYVALRMSYSGRATALRLEL